jgi:hypothetical protein
MCVYVSVCFCVMLKKLYMLHGTMASPVSPVSFQACYMRMDNFPFSCYMFSYKNIFNGLSIFSTSIYICCHKNSDPLFILFLESILIQETKTHEFVGIPLMWPVKIFNLILQLVLLSYILMVFNIIKHIKRVLMLQFYYSLQFKKNMSGF